MKEHGFTLLEVLIALAIGSVLMVGAARTLPLLQQQNLRLLMQVQLQEELAQMMQTLEKAVRRAGYCHGQCSGPGLHIGGTAGSCLLVRWDENSNGKWEGPAREGSDYYGYRLRAGSLEVQRGVAQCDGGGWERLNDPRLTTISQFQVIRTERQISITLAGLVRAWPDITHRVAHWLTAENL